MFTKSMARRLAEAEYYKNETKADKPAPKKCPVCKELVKPNYRLDYDGLVNRWYDDLLRCDQCKRKVCNDCLIEGKTYGVSCRDYNFIVNDKFPIDDDEEWDEIDEMMAREQEMCGY